MDNFTHSLTGWALGQAGLKRRTGLGLAALIVSANLPDIDILSQPLFGLPYIQYHRGFTHGIGGYLLLPFFPRAWKQLAPRNSAPSGPAP